MTHILIPREPNAALLRPFTGCPADELPLAWAAMVRAAEVQNARAGAAPAAVAGPANDLAELAMLNKLIKLGTQAYGALAESNSDDGPAGTAAYVRWQERRAEMGELIRAHKAPALEAPAAPVLLGGWKRVPEMATREMCAAMLSFLKDGFSLTENGSRPMSALYAELLAAAPQAPAAPVGEYTLVDEGGPVELAVST